MEAYPSDTILLVEDDDNDVFFVRRALEGSNVTNPLQVVTDGRQAMDYLSGAGAFADRDQYPVPFLILLDLKLPYVSGFEILTWIRQKPQLAGTVTVVLTGSAEIRDKDRAYNLGARSYLVKPPSAKALAEVLESLDPFWLSKSSKPPVQS